MWVWHLRDIYVRSREQTLKSSTHDPIHLVLDSSSLHAVHKKSSNSAAVFGDASAILFFDAVKIFSMMLSKAVRTSTHARMFAISREALAYDDC